MSTPDYASVLASEVARLKEAAIRQEHRSFRALAALFIAGVVVGVAAWFIQPPKDRDDAHRGLCLGLGGAVFCLGCIGSRMLFPRKKTKCPQCGYDWQPDGGTDEMLTWNCCPGCGLKMSDDTGCHEKP